MSNFVKMELELLLVQNQNELKKVHHEINYYIFQAIQSKKRFDRYIKMALCREKKLHKTLSRVKLSTFWEEDVPKFTKHKFKNSFRMERDTFKYICDNLKHVKREDVGCHHSISLEKRLAIALYSLGSSAEYRNIANLFGVDRTTVGEIVLEICHEIWKVFNSKYLNFYPPSEEQLLKVVNGFEILGFPQCSGAIGGCHIELKTPKDAVDYCNLKGWHSMVLFAAVDSRCKFTYISIESGGRTDDSTIFEGSKLKRQHLSNSVLRRNKRTIEGVDVPILLIGGSVFKLSSILMKSFSSNGRLSGSEMEFNYRLSKSGRVVDNAFSHLKSRFQKLSKGLELHVDNAAIIIRACCVLHNICNNQNDTLNTNWLKELLDFEKRCRREQPNSTSVIGGDDTTAEGINIRKALSKYFDNAERVQ